MKKDIQASLILFTTLNALYLQNIQAQSIKFVPYPNGRLVAYNAVFISAPMIYGDNLYFICSDSTSQLGYSDGHSTTLIPNLTPNSEILNIIGVYNNNLCVYNFSNITVNSLHEINMAYYNGNSYSIFQPPGSLVFTDYAGILNHSTTNTANGLSGNVIYNNDLFFNNFSDTITHEYETARFDGTQFVPIPNPADQANTYFIFQALKYFATLNSRLYITYLTGDILTANYAAKLGLYNGNGYTNVSTPGNAQISYRVTYNNKMYLVLNNTQLAIFDGSSFQLFPFPDAGKLNNFLNVYNNKLYFNYTNQSGTVQLAQFDGTTLSLIPNPDNSTDSSVSPGSIVYDNKLYFQYKNKGGIYQWAQFNGTSISLIPNPDNGLGVISILYSSQYPLRPIIYNNKLFFSYRGTTKVNQLAQFDGNAITLIPNPDTGSDSSLGYCNNPTVYKNSLYFTYLNDSGISRLAYLDEIEIAPVNTVLPASPDTEYASYEYTDQTGWTNYYYDNNTPNNFTDDTLLLSLKKNGQNIGTIGDGTFNVKLVATSGAGSNTGIQVTSSLVTNTSGFWAMNRYWQVSTTAEPSTSVGIRFFYNNQDLSDVNGTFPSHNVTNNKLIFYKAEGGNPDPTLHFAGVTKLISILPASYASDTTWTYHTFGVNTQYAEFSVSSFSGGGGGATGNNLVLPVSLLNFSAEQKNNNAFLNWQTVTEENTSYFKIQRSTDGSNFNTIEEIAAAGNSTVVKNYTYTDVNAGTVNIGTLYYRLEEVDVDGKIHFSKIISIQINTLLSKINVYPNPANNIINIDLPNLLFHTASITICDMSGKKILGPQNIANNMYPEIKIKGLSNGNYMLVITDKGKKIFTKAFIVAH